MPSSPSATDNVTLLLQDWGQRGDVQARDRMLELLYAQLREMAALRLAGAEPRQLQPTALVHEALLRMLESNAGYVDRVHFLSLAALKMRSVLVDQARAMAAAKRGGGNLHLTLSHAERESAGDDEAIDVLALDAALTALATVDRRAADAVEWMYFSGMRREEIAAAQHVSVPTVDRDLRFARAWLKRHLAGGQLA
ncbi:ECF-type sigma factor [Stenotrophomonas tumulicola]|uniref:RNA polymerase subunit sigma-24 n=1 Tax=Stenotrophomonas tumulicola TaxID=1685415 RepID=A0A7W3FIV2_9GAMM|nr:ECF-type sigma factor [Stenotrophomonas tumulicola]MBA8680280.1 RNA polymerase subunit sigma-24 [Stenotrophomonas tumulicola]